MAGHQQNQSLMTTLARLLWSLGEQLVSGTAAYLRGGKRSKQVFFSGIDAEHPWLSVAVSPRFTVEDVWKGGLEGKVDVFEDQVFGYVLLQAKKLLDPSDKLSNHSGVAVLMLIVPYLEQIACYLKGESSRGKERQFLAHGLQEVTPRIRERLAAEFGQAKGRVILDSLVDALYVDLRCGLFHDAMIRGRIVISQDLEGLAFAFAIREDGKIPTVLIDVRELWQGITMHFVDYIRRLRDPTETTLRSNFERFFDSRVSPYPPALPIRKPRSLPDPGKHQPPRGEQS